MTPSYKVQLQLLQNAREAIIKFYTMCLRVYKATVVVNLLTRNIFTAECKVAKSDTRAALRAIHQHFKLSNC